ncbi:unnamed protein product, partial [Pylaiella littoralis]
MQGRVKVPYADLLPTASEASIALLEGLLVFDPPCRFSAEKALAHRYFQPLSGKLHVDPDPVVAPGFDFDFESEPMLQDQLRAMILQEVQSFHEENEQEEEEEEEAEQGAGQGYGNPEAAIMYHPPPVAAA